MANKKKIVLVLGGGGARGIAHIGVLKILEENDIRPDIIVGVSMGAIVGAVYGLGYSPKEMMDFANSLKAKQIAGMFRARPQKAGLINPQKAFDLLNQHFVKDQDFSAFKIPVKIVAASLQSGRETIIKSGDIIQALRASSAVPGIFPPVNTGEDLLTDGGVLNPTPVDIAHQEGADVIIAVDLVAKKFTPIEKPNILRTLLQTYEIVRSEAVRNKFSKTDQSLILIEPLMRSVFDSFRFHRLAGFLDSGEKAAAQALPEIKKLLNR